MKAPYLHLLGRRGFILGASACAATGCFGSFNALRSLWSWNDEFDSKWVKWLVFLGLVIIPVYGLFGLADVLVLNSLEFWTGDNPVSASNGRTFTRVATADPATIRVEVRQHGQLQRVVQFRRLQDGGLQLLNEQGKVLTQVHDVADGVELSDGNGSVLARLTAEQLQQTQAELVQGRSASLALNQHVAPQLERTARAQQAAQGAF